MADPQDTTQTTSQPEGGSYIGTQGPQPDLTPSPIPVVPPAEPSEPKSGMFKFKDRIYEARKFDGTVDCGQKLCEWMGKATITVGPQVNLLKLMEGDTEFVVYPGYWIVRLDNNYLVLPEEALYGRMEEVPA